LKPRTLQLQRQLSRAQRRARLSAWTPAGEKSFDRYSARDGPTPSTRFCQYLSRQSSRLFFSTAASLVISALPMKARPSALAEPHQHRTAAPDALGLPAIGAGLNEDRVAVGAGVNQTGAALL